MASGREYTFRLTLQGAQVTAEDLGKISAAAQAMAAEIQSAGRKASDGLADAGAKAAGVAGAIAQAFSGANISAAAENLATNLGGRVAGALDGLVGSAGALGSSLSLLGPIGLAAGAGIGFLVERIAGLKAYAEIEVAQLRIAAVLKATGDASGLTEKQLASLVDEIGRGSFATKAQIRDAEAALLTFSNLGGENFIRTLKAADDATAVYGGDVKEWAVKLGQALEDPIAGLDRLRRAHIILSDAQKDHIRNVVAEQGVEAGQSAELDLLIEKFGGAAEGEHSGLAGAYDNAGKAQAAFLRALNESPGMFSLAKAAAEGYANVLNALRSGVLPTVDEKIAAVQDRIKQLQEGGALGQGIGALENGIGRLFGIFDNKTGAGLNLDELKKYLDELQAIKSKQGGDQAYAEEQAQAAQRNETAKRQNEAIAQGTGVLAEHAAAVKVDRDNLALSDEQVKVSQTYQRTYNDILKAMPKGLPPSAIEDYKRQASAIATAAASVEQMALADKDAAQADKDRAKFIDDEQKALDAINQKRDETSQKIQDLIGKINAETEAGAVSDRERAITVQIITAENIARADTTRQIVDGHALRQAEIDDIRAAAGASYDQAQAHKAAAAAATAQAEAAKNAQREIQREIEHTTNQIVDEGAKFFDNEFFSKTEKSWKQTLDNIRSLFGKAISQMAAEAFIRPIIQPIIADVAQSGALGLVNNSANALRLIPDGAGGFVQDTSGAGGSLSSVGNGIGIGSFINGQLGGSGASLFSGAGALSASSINAFGAAHLGLADVSSSFVGPLAEGQTSGLTLTGALGDFAAGAGAALSIYNFAQHPTLGNGIGAAGATIGAGLTIAGFPEIGIPIAIASALIGSLLKTHPEHPTGQAEAVLNSGGGATGDWVDFTTDKGDAAGLHDSVTQSLVPFSTSLAKQYGLDLSGTRLGILNNAGTTSFSVGRVGDNKGDQPISQLFGFNKDDQQSVKDAMTKAGLALLQMSKEVADANLAVARFKISTDESAADILKEVNFATSFAPTVAGLNSGGGFDPTKSIEGAAKQNADGLFASVKDFLDTTTKLFAGGAQIQQAADATKNYVLTLIGLRENTETTLSPMESAVKAFNAQIADLKPTFDLVGISAAQITAAVQKQNDAFKAAENKALDFKLDSLTRPDFAGAENALDQITAEFTTNLRDAVAAKADQSKPLQIAALEAAAAIKTLSGPELDELKRKSLGVAGGWEVLSAALDNLGASTQSSSAAIVDAASSMVNAIGLQAAQLESQAADIRSTIVSLLTGSESDLNPQDRIALGLQNLTAQNAGSLLQYGQGVYGGASQAYADLEHDVLSRLAGQGSALAAQAAEAPFRQAAVAASLLGRAAPDNADAEASAIAAAQSNFLNSLPHYAAGGVADRPAIFGEAGLEAAVPLTGGRRIPVELRGGAGESGLSAALGDKLDAIAGLLTRLLDATRRAPPAIAAAMVGPGLARRLSGAPA